MDKRIYNIVFDTHTVAGIIISVALYVIFFAGTISFLRDEIIVWEDHAPVKEDCFETTNFDRLLVQLAEKDTLYSRDISFRSYTETRQAGGSMSARKDIKEEKKVDKRGSFFVIDLENGRKSTYFENYSLGEFFYRLHFFAQLNFWGRSGYYFAGIIAFFFLFTLITGLIIHWDKIVQNFYVFRPKTAWKNIWTDGHTALGMIGLPYQLMYAITGAYFIVGGVFLVEPAQKFIFGDDKTKIIEAYTPKDEIKLDFLNQPLSLSFSVNEFIQKTKKLFPSALVKEIQLTNYADKNMLLKVVAYTPYQEDFTGNYSVIYRVSDGSILHKEEAKEVKYADTLRNIIARLHFGDYGGYGVRFMYILLGFLGCFVIISGVLIWFVARDKKNISEHKRKQNRWVVNCYLSICLSMLPATAFTFLTMKILGNSITDKHTWVYSLFFYSWLALSVFFVIRRSNFVTNKYTLLLGAILALLIPIADGYKTGSWLWETIQRGETAIFVVNFFWLLIGIIALWIFFKLKK